VAEVTQQSTAPLTTLASGKRQGASVSMSGVIERWGLVIGLVALAIVCVAYFPQFRTQALLATMINNQSLVLLLALTATVVLRVGDFDLSICQVMVASAALTVQLATRTSLLVAALAGVGLGAGVGLINGFLVVKVDVDSFVATLGSFTALAGIAYLISGSQVMSDVPGGLVNSARSELLGLPLITWYAWGLTIILWYLYQRTPLGRFMIFIGGNRAASRLSGVPVDRIRLGAYLVSGVLASLVGLCFAGYFGAVDPSVGSQFMLQPFAAAFLGATVVTVSRFNAVGTIVALYFLTIGITALQLLGADTWISNVFYGVALMVGVTAARLAGRRRSGAIR
jgi:ribose transport system permease protein